MTRCAPLTLQAYSALHQRWLASPERNEPLS